MEATRPEGSDPSEARERPPLARRALWKGMDDLPAREATPSRLHPQADWSSALERYNRGPIYELAAALEEHGRPPPTREGEERLFPVPTNLEVNPEVGPYDPPADADTGTEIQARLVARWLVDERGNQFLGWVYVGAADTEPYAREKAPGERLETWLTRELARSTMRVRVIGLKGDTAMIEAELRAAPRDDSARRAKGAA